MGDFKKLNAVIAGISRDKPATQKKWADAQGLPYPLLSDPEARIHKKYGAWGEKIMYGKKTEGVIRSTFVIGEDGVVQKAYTNVKAKGHAAKVLADLAGQE